MDKDQVLKNITKVLKRNKLSVLKKRIIHKEEHLIFTEAVVVFLDKNQRVSLAFHVASRPEFSAKISLEFKETDGVEDVNIGEVFVFNKENEMITGDEAVEEFGKQTHDGIVKSFIRDQLSDHMLQHGAAKNC